MTAKTMRMPATAQIQNLFSQNPEMVKDIVKEALDHVPTPLLDQLKPGGRLVIPLGSNFNGQYLTVVEKSLDGAIEKRRVLPVRFSVLQGGERT